MPSDCPVVRDNGGGPNASPRLWPKSTRAPSAAPWGRWPPAPGQHLIIRIRCQVL